MSAPTPANAPEEGRAPLPAPSPVPSAAPVAPYTPPAPPPLPPMTPSKRRTGSAAAIIAVTVIVVLAPVALCVGAALLAGMGGFLASRQVEQTATSRFQVAVPDHPAITVLNTAGQVTITRGAVRQVTVVATKHARAWTDAAARDLVNAMTVTAVPVSGGAQIQATTGQNGPLNQRSVDLRITVPQTSDLRVTVNAGTITVASVAGVLNLTADAGTVDLRDMTLQGATTIRVSAGTLNVTGALADGSHVTASVATGNANIWLPASSATHLSADTQVGSVTVTPWAAAIHHSGAGQSTEFDLNANPTNSMTVHVDVGSIKVTAR